MPSHTGIVQSIAVPALEQTFAGPGHSTQIPQVLAIEPTNSAEDPNVFIRLSKTPIGCWQEL